MVERNEVILSDFTLTEKSFIIRRRTETEEVLQMKYKSLSLRKLYILAAWLCGGYVIVTILLYIFSGMIVNGISDAGFISAHSGAQISALNKVLLCLVELVWVPYLIYTIGCADSGYSAKRCRRTFKAAPVLWLLAFFAEHILNVVISRPAHVKYQSESWLIQRTEYAGFFAGTLNIASLVLVCTAAALGIDEVRHFNHMSMNEVSNFKKERD